MSIQSPYPVRNTTAEVVEHSFLGVGTGADELTVSYGVGVTSVRQSAGVHRLSFAEHPGTFVGYSWALQAASPDNVAGHTVVLDTWVDPSGSTLGYFDVHVFNASDSAHDLVATELVSLTFRFIRTLAVG